MPPLLMGKGRPRWWSGRSARRLGVVACGFAVAAALLVFLCFVGARSSGAGSGGGLSLDFARTMAAGTHSGDQAVTEMQMQELIYYAGRRLLSGGPGSHPPRCTSKCGSCSSCYPVHVSVPPGVLVTTEYYPEAWRCKCRNQLYMP